MYVYFIELKSKFNKQIFELHSFNVFIELVGDKPVPILADELSNYMFNDGLAHISSLRDGMKWFGASWQ